MTRSRENILLGIAADQLANVAWTATHRKDNKRVHLKGLKDMSEAYGKMKVALGKNDIAAFHAASDAFNSALDAMHAAETEQWEV